MDTMTSPERVHRVLAGEMPDRVPVLLQNFQNTAWLAGMNMGEFCRSGELMAEAQLSAWERLGHDVIDLENGTAALAEALGCEVEYPDDEPPRVTRPALKSLDDLDSLKSIDPARDGHLPELLRATGLVRRGVGQRACIVGEADQGPFDLASLLLGMEAWLVALVTPELHAGAHSLLEFCAQQALIYARAQSEAGADFVEVGDALASPDVCSPRLYRRFAFPYEQRLAKGLSAVGIPLVLHICGNATSIIADMGSTGAAMLEIDYKIDHKRARAATSAVLVGDVDPSGVMALGTPDDVEQRCRATIEALGSNGRFILSPGCTLPATTPFENSAAMVEAARRHGQYGASGLLTTSVRDREGQG
jgi:uroporphyrinogen decarboxylase